MPRVLVLVTAGSADAGRGDVDRSGVAAQRAQQPVQLVDGLARARLDRRERRGRGIRVLRDHPPCGSRLHADDRHVVRDHVVQLARDAQPFDRDGLRPGALALGGELGGALLELGARSRRSVRRVAEVPRPAEVQQVREHVDEPEREVGRDDALAGELGQLVGRHRADDQPPEQPHEHADDDDAAHDVRPQSVPAPRAHRVDRDEQGDVREQRLADLGHRADDEGTGCHERHDLGPPPPRGERQVHRGDPEDRSPPRGALAPAGDAIEHDARGGARCEHEGQHQVVAVGGAGRARADPLDPLDGPRDGLGHASTLASGGSAGGSVARRSSAGRSLSPAPLDRGIRPIGTDRSDRPADRFRTLR